MKAYARILLLVLVGSTFLLLPKKASASEAFKFTDSSHIEAIGSGNSPFRNGYTFTWDGKDNLNPYFTGPTTTYGSCTSVRYVLQAYTEGGKDVKGSLAADPKYTQPSDCNPMGGISPTVGFIIDKNGVDPFAKGGSLEKADTTATKQCGDISTGGFLGPFKVVWSVVSGKVLYEGVICPIITGLTDGVTRLISEVLQPLLRIQPLSSGTDLFKAWGSIRNLADIGFVLAFLVIIFANVLSINLDAYTIKKMLPRLVAAAILVQFSFLICGVFVDIGNVLGDGVGALIGTLGAGGGNSTNILLGVGSAVGAGIFAAVAAFNWVLIIPLLIGVALAAIGFLLTLGVRYILITVLIILSPLALLAWILPNTEQYFRQWSRTFMRLILMYPLIMAIIAAAKQVPSLIPTADTTNGISTVIATVMKAVVFVAALGMIPWTFKWAGGMMEVAASRIKSFSSKASGAAQGKLKDSDWYKKQDAKNKQSAVTRTEGFANKIRFGNKRQKAAGRFGMMAARLGGAPTTDLARERQQSQLISDPYNELKDLSAASNPSNLQDALNSWAHPDLKKRKEAAERLRRNAPSLQPYTRTAAGRAAMIRKLADDNLVPRSVMRGIAANAPLEYGMALRAAGSSFSKKPAMLSRYAEGEFDRDGVARHAGELKAEPLAANIKGLTNESLKRDHHPDNLEMGAEEREVAAEYSKNLDAELFGNAYEQGRNMMDVTRRAAGLKMLGAQRDTEFSSGNGQAIRNAVADKFSRGNNDALLNNEEVVNDVVSNENVRAAFGLGEEDDVKAMPLAAKQRIITRDILGIDGYTPSGSVEPEPPTPRDEEPGPGAAPFVPDGGFPPAPTPPAPEATPEPTPPDITPPAGGGGGGGGAADTDIIDTVETSPGVFEPAPPPISGGSGEADDGGSVSVSRVGSSGEIQPKPLPPASSEQYTYHGIIDGQWREISHAQYVTLRDRNPSSVARTRRRNR